MPPKEKFTREEVIRAAYEIVEDEGLAAISARKVAQKLHSSVAPIYSQFDSIEELKHQALTEAKELLIEHTRKQFTDRLFLNMGAGIVIFARENKRLYRALFLENLEYKRIVDEFIHACSLEMSNDIRFKAVPQEVRDVLLTKMWIFTHGLASLTCVGLLDDDSDEYIIKTLENVGATVISEALGNPH